ncbi:MAG TPA: carbon storage regulator CsrA [Anaerolineales bacterium]|nr:carbon storage regulator CsrA [Anaerolineales bacterium]HNN12566.1 carbon storage regulator CsrA [Anaerolineales bacterium]HNO30505.1 carbon storage regulator CsrA [Anaerolineales bacterium]
MLVISRKTDESITIGDNITVTILAVDGDRVKIGIEAPRSMVILRQEIYQAVQEQSRIQEMLAEESKPDALEQLRKLLASEAEEEVRSESTA